MAIANTTLQIRKSGTTGVKPTTLANGELALNYADGKLYYKNSLGAVSYFYGPSFSTANANNTLILASTPNDIISIVPGTNINITACTITKTITFDAAPGAQGAPGTGAQGAQGAPGAQGVSGGGGGVTIGKAISMAIVFG